MDGSNLNVAAPSAARPEVAPMPAEPAAAVAALPPAVAAASIITTGCEADLAPISRIVAEVAAHCSGERVSLGEMAEAFGDRAFGLLILLLLLPALLPGLASVFGTPILILGIQMGLGMRVPRLPAFVSRMTIRRADLLRLNGISSKPLKRIERYVRPRPGPFVSPLGDRLVGWLSAYVALMLILPGPGTNAPPAFGNIVMALGLVEHDSRVVGLGVVLTVLGCAFATAVLALLCWFGYEALRWFI
ncbi:exopolysaccharide biosynthesis protein [Caldovatus aquaticus]|nr:exopolysaccharide biosynthesis protein [Caldovatus aquaticus]